MFFEGFRNFGAETYSSLLSCYYFDKNLVASEGNSITNVKLQVNGGQNVIFILKPIVLSVSKQEIP